MQESGSKELQMAVSTSAISSFLIKIGAAVALFLLPLKPIMISVSFLVIADLIVGVLAALKQGKKIESGKLRMTVSKTVAYQLGLITALVMEQQFIPGVPIVKVVAGLIAISECKSVLENVEIITGVPLKDFIAQYIQPPRNTPKQ